MNENVNDEITDRIASIDDDDLQSFVEEVVNYERQVLAQKQPHYKREFRQSAQKYLGSENGGTTNE